MKTDTKMLVDLEAAAGGKDLPLLGDARLGSSKKLEWAKLGADTPEKIKAWADLGVHYPEQCERWQKAGADTPEKAKAWMEIAEVIAPEVLKGWQQAGIRQPQEARDWKNVLELGHAVLSSEFDEPQFAQDLKSLFKSPERACEWIEAGFEINDELAGWVLSKVYSPAKAIEWIQAGFSPKTAGKWTEIGVDSPAKAREWIQARFDHADAQIWISIGVDSPAIALAWIRAEIYAVEAEKWKSVGVHSPAQALEWKWSKFKDVENAGRWTRIGVDSPQKARALIKAGLRVDDAQMWLANKFSVEEAIMYTKANVSLDVALLLRKGVPPAPPKPTI